MSLNGKTVVVVGGSSGIGLEVALQARAAGAAIVLIGRTPDKLASACKQIEGALGFQGDAHDHAAFEKVMDGLPPFDHLAALIGDTMAGGFLSSPIPVMQHVLFSKFWTNLAIARLAARQIRDGGSIVLTSGSGVRAHEACASYTANLGIEAMVQGLASELGPRVRVNGVAPSFMDTALWRNKTREELDARIRSFSQLAPMGRIASVQDVAEAYIFLMTNPFTTGQMLNIDGGIMLRK